jgi:methionyl-tRNA formyltransferase
MNHEPITKRMNIIFFGSDSFSVPCLRSLIASGHKISCVVTQPDKKKGRGLSLSSTPVKDLAKKAGLLLYQPDKINTLQALNYLKSLNPDLFLVIAYGHILSKSVLDVPGKFALNIHASFLPAYRGAAPINWAIIKGEKSTGITLIKMCEKMDAGPVISQKKVDITNEDTAVSLEEKLSALAAGLLPDILRLIEDDSYQLIPQDEERISFAPKLKKDDGLINWNKSAVEIYNLIRGSFPWPGAFTYYRGKRLKICRAEVVRLSGYPAMPAGRQVIRLPGGIAEVSKNGIVVACGNDNLLIKELQMEGKRIMQAQDFISGHKICAGDKLA